MADSMEVQVIVLTEDTGESAPEVIKALVEKMVHFVHGISSVPVPRKMIIVDEQEQASKLAAAMRSNGWKNRRQQIDFARELANILSRREPTLILLHMDGDCLWSKSEGGKKGQNVEPFENDVRPAVLQHLVDKKQVERISRLVLLVPYYNIEAWIFQNLTDSIALYEKLPESTPYRKENLRRLRAFEQDRTQLDEQTTLKNFKLLNTRENRLALAQKLPAKKAYAVGCSFTAAVNKLQTALKSLAPASDPPP